MYGATGGSGALGSTGGPTDRSRLPHSDNGPALAHAPWTLTPGWMEGRGPVCTELPYRRASGARGVNEAAESSVPREVQTRTHRKAAVGDVGRPPQQTEWPRGGSQGLSDPRDAVWQMPESERGHMGLWSSKIPPWICPRS